MDFGIFNLMGYREPGKTTAQVLNEATEQTRVAEALGFRLQAAEWMFWRDRSSESSNVR